jgi:hypothetical protein
VPRRAAARSTAGRLRLIARAIGVDVRPVSAPREIMAHHKRKRPKNRRAGCLLCKPWKVNGFAQSRVGAEQFGDHRRRLFAERAVRSARHGEFD